MGTLKKWHTFFTESSLEELKKWEKAMGTLPHFIYSQFPGLKEMRKMMGTQISVREIVDNPQQKDKHDIVS